MQKLRPRFWGAHRLALLMRWMSAIVVGGVVGICILSCDKPHKGGKSIVQESENINKMPAVYAPPALGNEWLDKQGAEGIEPTDVAGGMNGGEGLPTEMGGEH